MKLNGQRIVIVGGSSGIGSSGRGAGRSIGRDRLELKRLG